MENEIQQNVPSFQPLSQTPTPVLPPKNRLIILLFILLGIAVIAMSVFVGIQIGKNQTPGQQSIVLQPTTSPSQVDQTTIVGVIRTNGLSEDEKQKLGLLSVAYQLTDFKNNDQQDVYGYYLISSDKTIEMLLGKCVQITGAEPTEWKNKNKDDSYLRTAFVLNSINLVDDLKCSPYSTTSSENVAGVEKLTLRGIVNNSKRPAPDINYDYQVKLSRPFLNIDNSSGSPQQINLVDAIPDTNDVWIKLTDNINREVEIQGYMEWGYSESKYFRITMVNSI